MNQPLIVVLPFCSKDHNEAARLLEWIRTLDGKIEDHMLLLVADDAVPLEDKKRLNELGKSVFSIAEMITVKCPAPVGDNYHVAAAVMFGKGAAHIDAVLKWPWLWMEPDAVPLSAGWLDALAEGYERCPKRFFGSTCKTDGKDLPATVFFGTAVYPNCAGPELQKYCDGKKAFDVAFSDYVVPRSVNTDLIFHRFGGPKDPPTFKDVKLPSDGVNVGTLDILPQEAVLFHRCKDGTLIDLLSKELIHESTDATGSEAKIQPEMPAWAPTPKRRPGRPPKNPQIAESSLA